MRSIRGILLVLALLAPSSAWAQTEPVDMSPGVVVTADRFPTDP